MSAAAIARLKITLDAVKPTVMRRIEVPLDIRLDRLHLTIQAAMGWTNSHLYEVRAGDVGWSTPYPEADWADEFLDARKARLGDVIEAPARRRCNICTISAMDGSTRSRSNACRTPNPASPTRA